MSEIPNTSDGRKIVARAPKTDSYPVISVPDQVLQRYRAKVLDPLTAVQLPDQPPPASTVYISDQLIVSGLATHDSYNALAEAARRHGLHLSTRQQQLPGHRAYRSEEVARNANISADYLPQRVKLIVGAPAAPAPDAWSVLQTFR